VRSVWFALLALCGGVLLYTALLWPLPLMLKTATVDGTFNDSQAWCFWYMAELRAGRAGWVTDRIGWPEPVALRFIGWAPAMVVAPLQGVLGGLGAYNAALLLTGGLNALSGFLLARLLGARDLPAVAGGLLLAGCPFALDTLANGQIEKMQLWVLALYLVTVRLSMRWWLLLGVVPLSALLVAVTSPSLAMFLPVALGLLLPALVLERRTWTAAASGLLSAGLSAGALLWIRGHYEPVGGLPATSAFAPASVEPGNHTALLEGVARLDNLLLGGTVSGLHADHVIYLGLPALLVALALGCRREPVPLAGLALVLVGALLSLGPRLADSSGFISYGGQHLLMPAYLLEVYGYPIAESGMYHRFLSLSGLGLCLVVAGGGAASRTGRRHAAVALAIAALLIGDGLRQRPDRWPRAVTEVPGQTALAAIRADTGEGAVAVFPLRVDDRGGGTQIMLSLFHGRPTSGLPRYDGWRQRGVQQLVAWMEEAQTQPDPRTFLWQQGIRHVLWAPFIPHRDGGPDAEALTALLGPPQQDGALLWWTLP
jgi:hypothetical protein